MIKPHGISDRVWTRKRICSYFLMCRTEKCEHKVPHTMERGSPRDAGMYLYKCDTDCRRPMICTLSREKGGVQVRCMLAETKGNHDNR